MATAHITGEQARNRVGDIVEGVRAGTLDLLAHVEETCDRIDEIEPHLQALVPEEGRRQRMLVEAQGVLDRIGISPGLPLPGVIVGVKDIFHMDGFITRAGSAVPADLLQGSEAASVTRLRQAGAIILGKTVTTEFAAFAPAPTRNPHNPKHTPGGSSSGSAAGVAAGYSPLALGSQTAGSVNRPAAFCGTCGFKPTFDRIDIAGVLPCAPTVDTVGFFTQDVDGLQRAAAVLCHDWQPPATVEQPVLAIPEGPYIDQVEAEALEIFRSQVAMLEQAGYHVERVSALGDIEAIIRRHRLLQTTEMFRVHAAWFSAHEGLYREQTAATIREGSDTSDEDLQGARAGTSQLRYELEQQMADRGIDVWICPSALGSAPSMDSTGDPAMNTPWTHSHQPAVSLPGGHTSNGLPVGFQCAAAYGQDERLLEWSRGLEHVLRDGG
jgi:Asp-tRNA(Asn)/Glu-tRNA(Gln) amidotransferase A subunit family amidase